MTEIELTDAQRQALQAAPGKPVEVVDDEVRFYEEQPRAPLSDRDRDIFLALLDNPPPPNEALRRAWAKYKEMAADADRRPEQPA